MCFPSTKPLKPLSFYCSYLQKVTFQKKVQKYRKLERCSQHHYLKINLISTKNVIRYSCIQHPFDHDLRSFVAYKNKPLHKTEWGLARIIS